MECRNHPAAPALDRCAGCMEPFCSNCLVTVRGRKYCGSCKVMAVGNQMPMMEQATTPCPEAGEALKYALIGIICFGVILGPIAISKGLKAKKMMALNPALTGSGKATAAIIIGALDFILFIVGIMARVSNAGA